MTDQQIYRKKLAQPLGSLMFLGMLIDLFDLKVDAIQGRTLPKVQILKNGQYPHLSKVSLDVELQDRIDKDTLSRLGMSLKRQYGKGMDRVFICYYLPGMKLDKGAWASTHYTPEHNGEVKIYGLSSPQANMLKGSLNNSVSTSIIV